MLLNAHKSLICPKCREPFSAHEEIGCRPKVSRRWFLGAIGTAFATAAAAQVMPNVVIDAPAPDALVVTAAPRVIPAGAVHLRGASLGAFFWGEGGSREKLQSHIQYLADKNHRSVVVEITGREKDLLVANPNPRAEFSPTHRHRFDWHPAGNMTDMKGVSFNAKIVE